MRWPDWSLGCLAALSLLLPRAADGAAIFVMKPDGTGVRKVAQVEGCGGHGSPRFSHDDKRIAFDAGAEGNETRRFFVINLDGTGLREVGTHAMPDWSPDDKQLAYHNYGGTRQAGVYVQNIDGQAQSFLVAGGSPRWSPDGSQMAFTDWRTVKLLDLVSGEQRILVDEPFEEYQIGFDWSSDGKQLAFVGKRNNQYELWIAGTDPDAKARVRLTGDISSHVAFSPDGKRLALTIDSKTHLLDVEGDKAPELVPGQEGSSRDVAWSHDGKWIAFASNRPADGAGQAPAKAAWKLDLVHKLDGRESYNVAMTTDGQRAIVGGFNYTRGFDIWEFATGGVVTLSKNHATFLALAPHNRFVAGTGPNNAVTFIDMESGDRKRSIKYPDTVFWMTFSKDSKRFAAVVLDKTVHVHETTTPKKFCEFTGHKDLVFRAAFTPDGKEVCSTGQDKMLRVWNSATGEQRLEIPHPEAVWGVAVTPDGKHVLTGTGGPLEGAGQVNTMTMTQGEDNVLRLWELATGKLVNEMKGHTRAIYALDISADGRLAVTGGWDSTIRVWELESAKEIAQVQGNLPVMDVKFAPDGKRIVAGGGINRITGVPLRIDRDERARIFELTAADSAPAAATAP